MLALFLDIETTGLDCTRHAPIDIGIKAVDLATGDVKGIYHTKVRQSEEVWERRDPISIQVNGYTFEELQSGKEPFVIGREIIEFFAYLGVERGRAVFLCQNPAFDRGFFSHFVDVYTQERLHWPYHWLDLASMFWVSLVRKKEGFPDTINLSKNSIAQAYGLPAEVEPHRAMNGVNHLIDCYQAVVGWKLIPEQELAQERP